MMGLFAMRTAVKTCGASPNGGTRVRARTGWMLHMLAMMGAAAGGRLPDGVAEPQMQLRNQFQSDGEKGNEH